MHKLSHLHENDWVEHIHPASFQVMSPDSGPARLVAGVPHGNPEVFARLVGALDAPCHLLYVLHTPHDEGLPGRYQSPALERPALQAFVQEFSPYLTSDARFDLWAHSPTDQATVVWDRHNQIFAYGPLSRFAFVLQGLGFVEGEVNIPAPHQHHYRSEFDPQAARLLQAFDWIHSPLQEADAQ